MISKEIIKIVSRNFGHQESALVDHLIITKTINSVLRRSLRKPIRPVLHTLPSGVGEDQYG